MMLAANPPADMPQITPMLRFRSLVFIELPFRLRTLTSQGLYRRLSQAPGRLATLEGESIPNAHGWVSGMTSFRMCLSRSWLP